MSDPIVDDDHFIGLARRAIACPRWRWMRGMVSTKGQRIWHSDCVVYETPTEVHFGYMSPDALPDLADEATVGCLVLLLGPPSHLPAPWVARWHETRDLALALVEALETA